MLKNTYIISILLILSLLTLIMTGCQEGKAENCPPADTGETQSEADNLPDNGPEEPATISYDSSSLEENKIDYSLTEKSPNVQEKIEEIGFAVVPNKDHMALYQVYNSCKYNETPVFVTGDSILHTSHLIFDWYLRYLEIAHLRGDLINLTDGLLAKTMEYYDRAESEELKEAARKNSIYFTVAKILLTGGDMEDVPEDIKKIIKEEMELIKEHKGFKKSPLMGYKEDYSQYVPRGHYNRSPEFQQYFKAMIWYGRLYFPINDDFHTMEAILICRALKETKIKGETAEEVWNRIYETTAFFTGKSDDLIYNDYDKAIDKIYGSNYAIEELADKDKMELFREEVEKLDKPQILSTHISDIENEEENWEEKFMGFRFIGQRFTFDSYVFQNLVYDKVKAYEGGEPPPFTEGTGVRAFARGLDLFAVLGSVEAEKILNAENDTKFAGYEEQFIKLKDEAEKEKKKGWLRDLYNGRLWLLQSLIEDPPSTVPDFMKSKAWKKKQLNTALGSWTELKHDTILYTKQPYTMEQRALSTYSKGGEPAPTPEIVKGYVEPSIEIYQKSKLLIQKLRDKITELNYPEDGALENNLSSFEDLLSSLEEISRKELAKEELTREEYEFIENIGSSLKYSLSFGHYFDVSPDFQTEEDDKMPVIADVLTDVSTGLVLEEAAGPPFIIFAEVEIDKVKTICKGATYSHFEFKWPMDDRLTDEAWRDILENNKEPALADWTSDFIVIKEKIK